MKLSIGSKAWTTNISRKYITEKNGFRHIAPPSHESYITIWTASFEHISA